MRFACWVTAATDTHSKVWNFSCFSTTTAISRTPINATLYVNCLSCFFWFDSHAQQFYLKRFIRQTVYTRCTSMNCKIVPVTNSNRYVQYGASGKGVVEIQMWITAVKKEQKKLCGWKKHCGCPAVCRSPFYGKLHHSGITSSLWMCQIWSNVKLSLVTTN